MSQLVAETSEIVHDLLLYRLPRGVGKQFIAQGREPVDSCRLLLADSTHVCVFLGTPVSAVCVLACVQVHG